MKKTTTFYTHQNTQNIHSTTTLPTHFIMVSPFEKWFKFTKRNGIMILVICTVKWENKKKLFLIYFIVQQWVQKKMYEIKICFNKTNDFKMFWLNKQTKEMMSNNWKQNFNRMKSLSRIFKKQKQNVTRTKPIKKQQHQQQQQEKNMWIFKTNDKPMQNFKDHKYYVVWRIFHVKQKKLILYSKEISNFSLLFTTFFWRFFIIFKFQLWNSILFQIQCKMSFVFLVKHIKFKTDKWKGKLRGEK